MITIEPIQDTKPESIARALSVYLQGSLAFEYPMGTYGPFMDSIDKWQLDSSNDYWLMVDGDTIKLSWRYPAQERTASLMAQLLLERGLVQGYKDV